MSIPEVKVSVFPTTSPLRAQLKVQMSAIGVPNNLMFGLCVFYNTPIAHTGWVPGVSDVLSSQARWLQAGQTASLVLHEKENKNK